MTSNIHKNKKYGPVFLLAAMVWLSMPASNSLSAESAQNGAKIRSLTPMMEISSHKANFSAHDYFDVVGILNVLEGSRVIIGDRELSMAPGVRAAGINPWSIVGANLNRAGEVVVLEMISNDPN